MTNAGKISKSEDSAKTYSLKLSELQSLASANTYLSLAFAGYIFCGVILTATLGSGGSFLLLFLSYLLTVAARTNYFVLKDKGNLALSGLGIGADILTFFALALNNSPLPWLLTSLTFCLATALNLSSLLGKSELVARARFTLIAWLVPALALCGLQDVALGAASPLGVVKVVCLCALFVLGGLAIHLFISLRKSCRDIVEDHKPGWLARQTAKTINSAGNGFLKGVAMGGVGGAVLAFPIWSLIALCMGHTLFGSFQIAFGGAFFLGFVGLIFGGPVAAANALSRMRKEENRERTLSL